MLSKRIKFPVIEHSVNERERSFDDRWTRYVRYTLRVERSEDYRTIDRLNSCEKEKEKEKKKKENTYC